MHRTSSIASIVGCCIGSYVTRIIRRICIACTRPQCFIQSSYSTTITFTRSIEWHTHSFTPSAKQPVSGVNCSLSNFVSFSLITLPLLHRYSTAGSTHTLNNYCDTSDNWTDHDMEIYMTRNATTRNGLVPL